MSSQLIFGYPWDNGEPLSARGNDSAGTVEPRTNHNLLRPVFINAVEVGYAYSQSDKDKRLNVRGVTIAIWYFLSRGHQVLAMLPFCFKTFPDKSSVWPELIALFRMNLVEFTPGIGSEKYVEVNRILATRAAEVGGCIVARSQMHNIVDERPLLDRTIERRLLMPSFNGNDIIFPVDGPLGRNGQTLQNTLLCPLEDPEWAQCSNHQLTLQDQKIWILKLTELVRENVPWTTLATALSSFSPVPIESVSLPRRGLPPNHPKPRPPETNPPDGKGFSHSRGAFRYNNPNNNYNGYNNNFGGGYNNCGGYNNNGGYSYNNRGYGDRFRNMGWNDWERQQETSREEDPEEFLPEYMRATQEIDDDDCVEPDYLGHENSIYRLNQPVQTTSLQDTVNSKLQVHYTAPMATASVAPAQTSRPASVSPSSGPSSSPADPPQPRPSSSRQHDGNQMESSTNSSGDGSSNQRTPEQERLTKLALIFGWNKANAVIKKYPRVRNFNLLVEYAINEEENMSDDKDTVAGPSENTDQNNEASTSPTNVISSTDMTDLIDFSAPAPESVTVPLDQTAPTVSPPTTTHLLD